MFNQWETSHFHVYTSICEVLSISFELCIQVTCDSRLDYGACKIPPVFRPIPVLPLLFVDNMIQT